MEAINDDNFISSDEDENSENSDSDFISSSDDYYSENEDVIQNKLDEILEEFIKWFKQVHAPIIEQKRREFNKNMSWSDIQTTRITAENYDTSVHLQELNIFGEFHVYMALNGKEVPLSLAIKINQRKFLRFAFLECFESDEIFPISTDNF
jgi:hypothetical protein